MMSPNTSSEEKPPASGLEMATLAGGCFWCTEALFKRIKGVHEVISGYTGGDFEDPSYAQVSSGRTGHAEAVQVAFDPRIVSYDSLLEVFWATHDPTTLDRQGADVGHQYRSAIFYHSEEQRRTAEASKSKWQASGKLGGKIVTTIEPFKRFYPAEGYHQDYYAANPHNSYCSIVIEPKIRKLLRSFGDEVKEEYI
ncbi:MAG: peptide-methionine (S)-S-oxide reductase MsrA [Dehalococcoidia bacterium]